jgi:hypothetical protein
MPGPSGTRTAVAVPVTDPKQSTVDETRRVTLARTVVMTGKASQRRAAKPGSGNIPRQFSGTQRDEVLPSDSVTATLGELYGRWVPK